MVILDFASRPRFHRYFWFGAENLWTRLNAISTFFSINKGTFVVIKKPFIDGSFFYTLCFWSSKSPLACYRMEAFCRLDFFGWLRGERQRPQDSLEGHQRTQLLRIPLFFSTDLKASTYEIPKENNTVHLFPMSLSTQDRRWKKAGRFRGPFKSCSWSEPLHIPFQKPKKSCEKTMQKGHSVR